MMMFCGCYLIPITCRPFVLASVFPPSSGGLVIMVAGGTVIPGLNVPPGMRARGMGYTGYVPAKPASC